MYHIYSKTPYLTHLFFQMGKKINSLLYADDLVILSRSKTALQNCLNALPLYYDKWKLKINPKKTKIIAELLARAKRASGIP